MKKVKGDFRYDIAFLRAFAVLAVVLYHFNWPFAKDGYLGVDIFFVLSGYLMTKIILGRMAQGSFRLLSFYWRRALRILPALLGLLIFFFVLLYFVLGIKLYDYSRFALSSSLFVSNIYYYLSSGYFQPASRLNFLLHTWSLSVEWQFYAIYPLLLLGLRRFSGGSSRYDAYFLYSLALLSFACLLYYASRNSSFAFYMFPTRAWELLAGGVVWLHEKRFRQLFSQRIRNGIALFCALLLMFAASGLFTMQRSGWPSALTLLPVAAASLLILAQSEARLFRWTAVRFIADISYSWYLWHWPLLVLGTYFAFSKQGSHLLAAFILSFVLGVLSYYFLERNAFLRRPKWLLVTTLLVFCTALLGKQLPPETIFLHQRDTPLIAFQQHYFKENAAEQYGFEKGHLLSRAPFEDFDTTQLYDFSDTQPNYLLLGDCHAGMFAYTLKRLAQEHGVNLIQATGDESFPAPGARPIYAGPAALMRYMYERYLPENAQRFDKVILSANYAGYPKREVQGYLEAIEHYFQQLEIPLVYIGQTESYTVEYPAIETLRRKFGVNPKNYLQRYRQQANKYLKNSTIADRYIDVYCLPSMLGANAVASYMYDADHFSTFGTEQYADLFQQTIFSSAEEYRNF